jgi:hypothetical protein
VIEGPRPACAATAGSFLIDAERLDPAAAVTYFGASTVPESAPPADPRTVDDRPDHRGARNRLVVLLLVAGMAL